MEAIDINKKEIEFIYKGICPSCGKICRTTYGSKALFKHDVKLWCPECKNKFTAKEYEEATYQNNKLNKPIETRKY